MKFVPLKDLEEGMVIAADICRSSSRCLVKAGTSVNGPLIRLLKTFDVKVVPVKKKSLQKKKEVITAKAVKIDESNEQEKKEVSLTAEEQCKKEVAHRFRSYPRKPMMKRLFDIALKMEMEESGCE
jgi:hypothetical protein